MMTDRSRMFKKGSDFETASFLTLSRKLKDCFIMNNVFIPFNNNPAQIDILVVRGIIFHVLELKNYEHGLTGNLGDSMWIAQSNTRTSKVLDPVKQNDVQCFKLSDRLRNTGFIERDIRGYVIVPTSCRLNIAPHLRKRIMTLDEFRETMPPLSPNSPKCDVKRLRGLLQEWKL